MSGDYPHMKNYCWTYFREYWVDLYRGRPPVWNSCSYASILPRVCIRICFTNIGLFISNIEMSRWTRLVILRNDHSFSWKTIIRSFLNILFCSIEQNKHVCVSVAYTELCFHTESYSSMHLCLEIRHKQCIDMSITTF